MPTNVVLLKYAALAAALAAAEAAADQVPRWAGPWLIGTAYEVGDIVESAGSAYIAILAGTGHLPPDAVYWQLVAEKGDTGADGDPGPPGEDGAPGAVTNLYIQDGAPVDPAPTYLWIQTGLGLGGDEFTFWIEDGT